MVRDGTDTFRRVSPGAESSRAGGGELRHETPRRPTARPGRITAVRPAFSAADPRRVSAVRDQLDQVAPQVLACARHPASSHACQVSVMRRRTTRIAAGQAARSRPSGSGARSVSTYPTRRTPSGHAPPRPPRSAPSTAQVDQGVSDTGTSTATACRAPADAVCPGNGTGLDLGHDPTRRDHRLRRDPRGDPSLASHHPAWWSSASM
jgi:hypothetical protein